MIQSMKDAPPGYYTDAQGCLWLRMENNGGARSERDKEFRRRVTDWNESELSEADKYGPFLGQWGARPGGTSRG